MTQLNLWQGGVKIVTPTEFESQAQAKAAQIKFDTCRHRSDQPINKRSGGCCHSVKETGYNCNLRDIFKLTPETCASCTAYQAKSKT